MVGSIEWTYHPREQAPPWGKPVLVVLRNGFYDVAQWTEKTWENGNSDVVGWWDLPVAPRPVAGLRRV